MSAKRPKKVKLSKVFARARKLLSNNQENKKFAFCCHCIADAALELDYSNAGRLYESAKNHFDLFKPDYDCYAWWPTEEYTARVIALTWCELEAKEEERTSAL